MTTTTPTTTAGRIAALEAKQTATRAALWTCTDPEQGRALRREYDDNAAALTGLYADLGPVHDAARRINQ